MITDILTPVLTVFKVGTDFLLINDKQYLEIFLLM